MLGLFIRNRALRRLECFTVKAPRQVWTARVNGWGLNGEGCGLQTKSVFWSLWRESLWRFWGEVSEDPEQVFMSR